MVADCCSPDLWGERGCGRGVSLLGFLYDFAAKEMPDPEGETKYYPYGIAKAAAEYSAFQELVERAQGIVNDPEEFTKCIGWQNREQELEAIREAFTADLSQSHLDNLYAAFRVAAKEAGFDEAIAERVVEKLSELYPLPPDLPKVALDMVNRTIKAPHDSMKDLTRYR